MNIKKDVANRNDLYFLVTEFYEKVRKNKDISYFFKRIDNWEQHLIKITDFWESNLFFSGNFKGNPALAHARVDKENNHSITEYHFGIWLNLWFQTIDEHFEGEMAERLKHNARKMSTHLFLRIYQNRQKIKK